MEILDLIELRDSKIILGAHQDDLEIACAGLIFRTKDNSSTEIVYTTSGAPIDKSYYPRFGIDNPKDYSNLRKEESLKALSHLKINQDNITFLNFPDQKLFEYIEEACESITSLIEIKKPKIIISPSYEGGHPDHDITRLVAELSINKSKIKPILLEYAEYNEFNQETNLFKFIPNGSPIINLKLLPQEIEIKRKIFDEFRSQQKYISSFLESSIFVEENYRIAIPENFSKPPHKRPLHYETVNIKTSYEDVMTQVNEILKKIK